MINQLPSFKKIAENWDNLHHKLGDELVIVVKKTSAVGHSEQEKEIVIVRDDLKK